MSVPADDAMCEGFTISGNAGMSVLGSICFHHYQFIQCCLSSPGLPNVAGCCVYETWASSIADFRMRTACQKDDVAYSTNLQQPRQTEAPVTMYVRMPYS